LLSDKEDMLGFFICVVLFLLVAPWGLLFVRILRDRRQRTADELRWMEIDSRLQSLESALRRQQNAPVADAPAKAEASAAAKVSIVSEVNALAAESAAPPAARVPPPPPVAPYATVRAPANAAFSPEPVGTPAASWMPPKEFAGGQQPGAPAPVAPPRFAGLHEEAEASWRERLLGGLSLEESLGTNWLNKIGIVILVFGVAFFLAYQLRTLGPGGKVLIGYVSSAVLLFGGILLEKKKGYALLARAAIGGGWALVFFTTYAMHHVAAARVIDSQGLDLVLLAFVSAMMVGHTLRYRSQTATGLAFLLAFSTVTISHVTVYSLVAGVLLAAALVFTALRMNWFVLELCGLAAAYLNHLVWLWPLIEPMQGHRRAFAEFVPSAAILILYWAIFRTSYVLRRCESKRQEALATASALANTFALLGLFKYQSLHPEWACWALLVLGAAELAIAFVARPRRRMAYLVLSTLGVTLLFAALPFRLSAMNVSLLWAVGVEALLLVGMASRERLFRLLSFAAAIATTVQMLAVDTARVIGVRSDDAMPGRILPLGFALIAVAALFLANTILAHRRWREFFEGIDGRVQALLSWGALALLGAGLWVAFPACETAPLWAVAALLLGLLSRREGLLPLKLQSDVLAALAFLRALFLNLESVSQWGGVRQRLVTLLLCAAAFYAGSSLRPQHERYARARVPELYSWAASTLLFLLLWYELHSLGVAPAWALLGLLLVEAGCRLESPHLRRQGIIALGSALLRVFIANLAATGAAGELSPRLYSTVPVMAIFLYLYFRLDAAGEALPERRWHVAELCNWSALACFAALVRFELPSDWVVAAWAAMVPVLLAAFWYSRRGIFLPQALVLTLLTVARGMVHNLYARTLAPAPFLYSRALCMSLGCALLFASLWLAYKVAGRWPAAAEDAPVWRSILTGCLRQPQQTIFFSAYALLISLLAAEMRRGMLTVSWSLCGVLTFLAALWIGERSFRLAGLGLLLLGVAKILAMDMWGLGARDRYLTCLCMGSALLLVSYLYTKYREAIRQYL
jgi:uncharacterized membrane protein